MNKQDLKDKIKDNLEELPPEDLIEVSDFVEFLLYKKERKTNLALEGLWKGKGFEKIDDLEKEVRTIRREVEISMDKDLS